MLGAAARAPSLVLLTVATVVRARARRFIEISRDYENRRNQLRDLTRSFTSADGDGGDDTVPAAMASSFRTAARTLRDAIAMRSGRSSPGRKIFDGRPPAADAAAARSGEPEPEPEPPPADEVGDEELFSTMQGQWVEVECLLRVQLRTPEALAEARARVRASLDFDAVLGARAASSGVLKGAVFQALLAYADGSEASTAGSVGATGLSDEEWAELAQGSDALRKLVRIKVQDDNDLKAANSALASCAEFFDNLHTYSTRRKKAETDVLTLLEEV